MKDFWMSVMNRVLKGFKSIYDFVLNFIAFELAKHKWSIWLWLKRKVRLYKVRFYKWKANNSQKFEDCFKKVLNITGMIIVLSLIWWYYKSDCY